MIEAKLLTKDDVEKLFRNVAAEIRESASLVGNHDASTALHSIATVLENVDLDYDI